MRGFLIGGLNFALEGVKETEEGVCSHSEAEASRGTTLHNTSQNQVKEKLKALRGKAKL